MGVFVGEEDLDWGGRIIYMCLLKLASRTKHGHKYGDLWELREPCVTGGCTYMYYW